TGCDLNTIGGTAAGSGNVISGNGDGTNGNGVHISGNFPASDTVQGNLIGTQADGTSALGNDGNGILLDANLTTIGGTVAGAPNVIAFNGRNGVLVTSGEQNSIRNNSIF